LATQQDALAANHRERKQKDLDIATHQQKISKLRDQMMSAKTNEQYRAFQHEIEFCEAEIRKAEDRQLDLMAAAEPLDSAVKTAQQALAAEAKQVEAEKADAVKRSAADKQAAAEVTKERASAWEELPASLRTTYERLKKKHSNGIVVSDATKGVCTACQLQLRPKLFQDLKTATTVMFCENCSRILRYSPAVDQQAMYEGGTRVALS
jgi:predicted  nucleic acid-binding Zn-ribbon protein